MKLATRIQNYFRRIKRNRVKKRITASPHTLEEVVQWLKRERSCSLRHSGWKTVIADCRAVMEALTDCSRIDGEAEEVSNEMEAVAGMIQRLADGNAARKPQRGGSQHKDLKAAGRFQGVLDILPAVFMMIFCIYGQFIKNVHK